jgi:hypothetical protein
MTTGFIFLGLASYVLTLYVAYEVMKGAIKDALRELKAAEKKAAEKTVTEIKVQD